MEKFSNNDVWFMMKTTSEMYWVNKTSNVELLDEQDTRHSGEYAYYVKWEGVNEHTNFLTIAEIECVIECVKTFYGKTSKTYMEWTNLHGEILLRNKKGSI